MKLNDITPMNESIINSMINKLSSYSDSLEVKNKRKLVLSKVNEILTQLKNENKKDKENEPFYYLVYGSIDKISLIGQLKFGWMVGKMLSTIEVETNTLASTYATAKVNAKEVAKFSEEIDESDGTVHVTNMVFLFDNREDVITSKRMIDNMLKDSNFMLIKEGKLKWN